MKKIITSVLLIIILSFSFTYALGAETNTSGDGTNTVAGSAANNTTANGTAAAGSTATDTTATDTTANGTAATTASIVDLNNTYTIGELQEIAVSNSRQALADDMDIKRKEMAVRTVRSDVQSMSDDILSITKPMDVKLELDVAQRTKQDHFNQLKIDVYKAALNILLCEKEIAMQEQKLATAEEELKMATARFKAATITQNDLDSAQYSADDSKVSLANTKEKLDSLYLEMKKLLNQPLNTVPVKIKGEIKQDKFEDVDVDFQINRIYATETSVYKASGKLDIATTAMGIAKKAYLEGVLFYDNAAMDLKEAEYDLTAAKTALEVKVKNYYNTLVNDLDDLKLAGQYTDLMKKKFSNSEIMYKKGTISKDEFNKAKDALLDAQFAELSSIVEFNGARADFRNAIRIEEIGK